MSDEPAAVTEEAAARQWLRWDKNEKTRATVEKLLEDGALSELRERLGSRMEFGTAGLRAAMGAGSSCMNDLTVIQTTQGFMRYLEKMCPDLKQKGVVIGHDARADPLSNSSSKRFSRLAAVVFLSQGVPVYLFSQISPTPFVPYTVVHLGLSAGIMVTASHNPKQDNGYKVYWSNGAQIISPHDTGIARAIQENLEPWEGSWLEALADTSPLCKDPFADINRDYFSDLRKLCFHREQNECSPLKFVHTSVHGVGHDFVQSSFAAFGLAPPIAVAEQKDPDPEFPTVKYPNPEEGKGVLNLAIKLAEREGARVILANDPDADRLAVAERQDAGDWKVFTGNEVGALLGWWLFYCWKERSPPGTRTPLDRISMLSSTVSSKILRAIAHKEGFHFEETLTGFKWMGNRAKELMDQGKTVLFAFEEAIGFMCGTTVLDKDGVSAAAVAAEMAIHLATKKLTLTKQLTLIYEEYGYHISRTSYFICHEPPTIVRMFERLRNRAGAEEQDGASGGGGSGRAAYPTRCGPYEIAHVRDLTTGHDSAQADKRALLPSSSSSQMITFTFANGCVATMRTSGTEPKIKYYAEMCATPGKRDTVGLAKELDDLIEAMVENFFQPEKNGLIRRAA
ncbi:phosphopentomutase [Lampetra planeri]